MVRDAAPLVSRPSPARHLPNLLTIARILATPLLAWLIWHKHFRGAMLYCLLAGSTDALDGYLARHFAWGSPLGAALDPIADKLFLSTIYLSLGARQELPWSLVALIFGRDLVILTGVYVVSRQTGLRRFPPTRAGKISTFFQVITAVVVLAAAAWPTQVGVVALVKPLILGTAVATAGSGLHYIWRGWRLLRSLPA